MFIPDGLAERCAENAYAPKISAADVLKYNGERKLVSANLDIKNPHSLEALEHRDPIPSRQGERILNFK